MRAKDFLLQIKKIDKLIHNKLKEQQLLREQATGTAVNLTPDKVQSSGNPHRMGDIIVKYVDMENEINEQIDRLYEIKKDVISVIEQLEVTEYDVLHQIYVQGKSYDEVAYDCERTRSWATTIHGKALKNVQDILNKREYEGNR